MTEIGVFSNDAGIRMTLSQILESLGYNNIIVYKNLENIEEDFSGTMFFHQRTFQEDATAEISEKFPNADITYIGSFQGQQEDRCNCITVPFTLMNVKQSLLEKVS